jgi:hypothetical protein
MKTFVFAGALLAFASAAVAGDDPFPRRFKPNQFDQVVDLIEQNMQPGGEYEATADEQARIRALLGEIGGLLEGNERLADLDQNEKDAIEKRRGEINAILVGNARQEVAQQQTGPKPRRKVTSHLDTRPATASDF